MSALIVHNAKGTTLQDGGLDAEVSAVRGEKIAPAGGEADIMGLRENTRVTDAGLRRIISGPNDPHFHLVEEHVTQRRTVLGRR